MTAIPVSLTGKPKGDIIEMAFEECGSAGFMFERTPEEIASALRQLNVMMLEHPWNLLGYEQPDYGQGSAADLSGIPDAAVHVVTQHLALRLAPKMGASLSGDSRAVMARSFHLLQSELATPATALMASTPAGAGNRRGLTFIRDE